MPDGPSLRFCRRDTHRHTAGAQCGRLSAGGNGIVLGLVARAAGGTILDILRAYDVTNAWCVVMTFLLGIGALIRTKSFGLSGS